MAKMYFSDVAGIVEDVFRVMCADDRLINYEVRCDLKHECFLVRADWEDGKQKFARQHAFSFLSLNSMAKHIAEYAIKEELMSWLHEGDLRDPSPTEKRQ